jgi:DNA repair exonuclease SbcCD ATPase subunit
MDMKKIFYLVWLMIGLALLPACKRANQLEQEAMRQDSINAALQDSINTANAERDSLMDLMNDISEGMTQIKELEDIVSVNNLSSETPDRKKQLRDDIVLIQQSINKHKARLEELEKRLKQSTNYNGKMEKTIASLKRQLEDQQNTINGLTDQLQAAHIQIKNLNQSVDSLNTVNKAVTKEKEAAQEQSKNLTAEVNNLNTCYYVVGSNKELKANKIIESGFLRKTRILEGDFEMSYFTKADRRTLSEIPLHSNKAQLMTNHPKDSYEFVEHGNVKTLHILNADRFWEKSNFLVVKVD